MDGVVVIGDEVFKMDLRCSIFLRIQYKYKDRYWGGGAMRAKRVQHEIERFSLLGRFKKPTFISKQLKGTIHDCQYIFLFVIYPRGWLVCLAPYDSSFVDTIICRGRQKRGVDHDRHGWPVLLLMDCCPQQPIGCYLLPTKGDDLALILHVSFSTMTN